MNDKLPVDDSYRKKKPFIQIRWLLAGFGFGVNALTFIMKNSFAVAIVAMVNATESENITSIYGDVCEAANNSTTDESPNTDGEFYWNAREQGLILSAYTYGSIVSRMIGGRLGELYGQRLVVAICLTVAGVVEMLIPTIAQSGPYALFAARILLGATGGPLITTVQSLQSKWSPRHQLSSMLSLSFAGIPFGAMLGVITAGLTADYLGWKWIFWTEGLITLIFVPFWIFFVRNDPKDHPYVTPYESKILEGNKDIIRKKSVPWRSVLASRYVYVLILAQFTRSWTDGVQNTEGPTFFNKKIGLSLNLSSWVVGATSIIQLPCLIMFGVISDLIIRRKYVSRLNARRIMHFIGTGGFAVLFLTESFLGCMVMLIIMVWLLFGMVVSATTSSINVSIIDVAPNYAGTVMGLIGIGNIGGALSPLVASTLIQQPNGWRYVFITCALVNLTSCVIYILLITDKPQPWNFSDGDGKIQNISAPEKQPVSTISLESKDTETVDQSTHL